MASSGSSVHSKPYRGHNFPYHLQNPQPTNGFRLLNSQRSIRLNDSITRPLTADAPPSSYMVLNFRNQFVDEGLIESLHKDIKIEEKRLKQLQEECANRRTGTAPGLNSSFSLPKKVKPVKVGELVRNMIGRSDASTQADSNMNRIEFGNLSQYQNWTNSEVEPFFKVCE